MLPSVIDFNFKKVEDIEEFECFYILFERRSEDLVAPGTLGLESQLSLRFSNNMHSDFRGLC